MNTINNLLQKIEQAPRLDFGTIFGDAIELFKKTWLQGVLLQIFTALIMMPIIIVLYLPMIGMVIAGEQSVDMYSEFITGASIFYILFFIVGIFAIGTLYLTLNAAFFRIMQKMDHDETVATSDFFYFIKQKYLSKILLLLLISIGIAIPSALLCYVPLLYTLVPISYFMVLFAFNDDLSAGDIVKCSFKIGTKKWGISIGLFIVSYLCVSLISILTCGLGSIFLQPFLFHPLYLIYKSVIGFKTIDAIDEIGIISQE